MKKVLKSVLSLAMAFSVMQSTVSVYAEEMPEAEQETEITEDITETGEISEEEQEIPEEISEDEASPGEEPVIPEESAEGEQPETDPEVPAAEEEPAEEVQAAEVSQTQDTGETVPENEEEIYYEEAVVLGEGGLLSYDASIAALTDSQKALRNEIFRRMAQAAENFQTSVNIADLKVTTSEFGNLNIVAFYNKYPEYYYLQNGFSYSYSTYIISLTLRYDSAYPQSEVQTFRDRMNEILGMVDPGWNDEQKILFIHDYLVTHVEYDLTYSRYNAYDAIVTGSCVCQGYSEAFEALMHRLGIECDVISSNELNHAWNLVRLNGEYYYIDNTWDDYSNFYMGYCGHRNFLRNQAGIVGTDHSSTDWVNTDNELVYDNLQTSDTYDSYYWSDCSSYIPVISNKAYYVSDSKTDGVYVYDYATSSSRKLYSLTFRWNVYNNSSSWWGGNYASLEKYNDAVLCSTADSLYMIGTDGKGTKLYTLTSSEKADGYIYGIQVEGTRLRYDLYEKYDNSTFKGSHYYELPVPDVHVAGVSLSESELRLEVGETRKLTAVVSPAGADNKNVTWSVSSGSAVTVDQSGNVTAVSEGTAVVTVTTEDGGFTADCSVTVYDPAADQEAADEVSTLIADLPDDITIDDKDAVEEARAAYEKLTPEQKALVTNLEVLENAEAAIAKLKEDAAAAEAVYEMIDSLPSPVTLDDKAAVEAARAAYEALTDEQKELVT
ncbi:MAG: Ig-like domain-containing protein, partial [Solobacterium sp.]|nr:Ig-like domain-containing protein [Solobacterium sp.]